MKERDARRLLVVVAEVARAWLVERLELGAEPLDLVWLTDLLHAIDHILEPDERAGAEKAP